MLQVLAQPVHAVMTAGGPIKAVAFSADHGGLLATGGKAVMLYRLTTNRPIGSPVIVAGGVNGLAFTAAGTVLATAGGDGTARLWDVATGREIGSPVPASSSNGANAVAFGLNGTILATADGDGTARLWDVATHREIGPALIDGGQVVTNSQVTDVAFSPDGKVLATSSLDGTVRLWDVATGRQFGQSMSDVGAYFPSIHEMRAVTFNPAGTTPGHGRPGRRGQSLGRRHATPTRSALARGRGGRHSVQPGREDPRRRGERRRGRALGGGDA